jgi:hypothetical protein
MVRAAELAAPKLPIPELREFARVQVDGTGLRPASRASQIAPGSLRLFIDGSHPQDKTRRRLEIWYWRVNTAARSESDGHGEAAAILYLLRGLPPLKRARAAATLLAAVEAIYDERDQRVPWPRSFVRLAAEGADLVGTPPRKDPGGRKLQPNTTTPG